MIAAIRGVRGPDAFIVMPDSSPNLLHRSLFWQSYQVPGPHGEMSRVCPKRFWQRPLLKLAGEFRQGLPIAQEIVSHDAKQLWNRMGTIDRSYQYK